MDAEPRQHAAFVAIVDRVRAHVPELVRDVAADLDEADAGRVAPTVGRFLDMIVGGPGLGDADRLRLRQEGAAAARQGLALASTLDGYLSTAWVVWDHALRLVPPLDAAAMRALGAALLRAGDDITAEVAEGYTTAERALAATAGAARQAILEELLSPAPSDPASVSRLLRRAALAGLDPGEAHRLLVLRPSVDVERLAELADDLGRRLGRDPARRPSLTAVRGSDLVALVGGPWRDTRPFAEATAGLADDPWWAVVTAPVQLEEVARAYADAIDALRVATGVLPAHTLADVAGLALERALVADPMLAAAGVERWLAPLADARRGGPELVRTLAAWLEAGQSVTATARALDVAPRTVSYRLGRIATLLGVRTLTPDVVARLSAALLVARLLGRTA